MRQSILVAVVLIETVILGAAIITALDTTGAATTTTTVTDTIFVKSGSTTTIRTTSCGISGPTTGVVLQIIAYNHTSSGVSTVPWVGTSVSGEAVGYCNDALQTSILPPTTTNSTGWASLLDGGFGLYDLNVTYGAPPITFNLSIVTDPLSVTVAVFNISTGNMTTHFCEYNLRGCPSA